MPFCWRLEHFHCWNGCNNFMDDSTHPLLKVEFLNAMGILIIKGLLMVVIYHLLPKDETNGINEMIG